MGALRKANRNLQQLATGSRKGGRITQPNKLKRIKKLTAFMKMLGMSE
jgi:hypothetical protein